MLTCLTEYRMNGQELIFKRKRCHQLILVEKKELKTGVTKHISGSSQTSKFILCDYFK